MEISLPHAVFLMPTSRAMSAIAQLNHMVSSMLPNCDYFYIHGAVQTPRGPRSCHEVIQVSAV